MNPSPESLRSEEEVVELMQVSPSQTAASPKHGPFISVAIPTFRRPDTIRRAVDSVLNQDFPDWELVISDDEGPGGVTWSILSEYANIDSRVQVVQNHRGRGQVENTNNAMLACTGKWVKLLHDDDWLAQGALRTFAREASAHPSAAFLTCASNMVEEGRIHYRRPGEIVVYSSQQCLVDLYLVARTRELGIIPSTLLVNSSVIKAGCLMRTYKSIALGVDQLFFVDLACHGDMVVIDDGLIFYDATDHPSIRTSKSFHQADQETLDLKRLTWSLIKNKAKLPDPETMLRALRVARLRRRFNRQPWGATIRDIGQIFRPSVVMAANQAMLARVLGPRMPK